MSPTNTLVKALLLLYLVLPPTLACAQSQRGTREAMADAMVRMMDAMGMLSPSTGSSTPSSDPWYGSSPYDGPSWVPAPGGFGMPWPGRGAGGMMPFAPGASTLEGVWEGRNGELVIVQGERFRIYSSDGRHLDGFVRYRGNRMAMHVRGEEKARPFEFAESRGRLILRDGDGQLYIYRRLRLDNPERRAPGPAYGR